MTEKPFDPCFVEEDDCEKASVSHENLSHQNSILDKTAELDAEKFQDLTESLSDAGLKLGHVSQTPSWGSSWAKILNQQGQSHFEVKSLAFYGGSPVFGSPSGQTASPAISEVSQQWVPGSSRDKYIVSADVSPWGTIHGSSPLSSMRRADDPDIVVSPVSKVVRKRLPSDWTLPSQLVAGKTVLSTLTSMLAPQTSPIADAVESPIEKSAGPQRDVAVENPPLGLSNTEGPSKSDRVVEGDVDPARRPKQANIVRCNALVVRKNLARSKRKSKAELAHGTIKA